MRIFRTLATAQTLLGREELAGLVENGRKSLLHRDSVDEILKFDAAQPNYVPFYFQAQAEGANNSSLATPNTFFLLTSADAATYGDRVIPSRFFDEAVASAAFEIEMVLEYHLATGVTMTFKVSLCDQEYNELAVLYERDFHQEDDMGILSLRPVLNYTGYGYGDVVEGQAVWASALDHDVRFIDAPNPGDNVAILFFASWDSAENASWVTLYNARAAYMRPVVPLNEIPG